MATVLPPKSKRQKLADSKRTQEQQKIQLIPEIVPNVVVHLRASDTGDQLGGELHIPGNSTAQQLDLLVNSLLRTVTAPIPAPISSLYAVAD
jgi:ribosome assembly protein 4